MSARLMYEPDEERVLKGLELACDMSWHTSIVFLSIHVSLSTTS